MSGAALLALIGAGLLAGGAVGGAAACSGRRPASAARLATLGAALLASSVLADSAIEHYRGSYQNRAMYVAPVAAVVTLAAAVATAVSNRARMLKAVIFGGSCATGLFGLGFHVKNILSRPGGVTFNNLFYRAPFGAPAALTIAGAAGVGALRAQAAEQERDGKREAGEKSAGRHLGVVTAFGMFGLMAEIGLLHFRGAFHNKLMYAPIVAAPLAGAAMAAACDCPTPANCRRARLSLIAMTTLGAVGTGLHVYGVSRGMGGFRNWTQNVFDGPPIAAPPSLAGMALMGFSALRLLRSGEEEVDDG